LANPFVLFEEITSKWDGFCLKSSGAIPISNPIAAASRIRSSLKPSPNAMVFLKVKFSQSKILEMATLLSTYISINSRQKGKLNA
jgi:hypothetical protein